MPPLPILVVDDDPGVVEAVTRARDWVAPSRPVMLLPQEEIVGDYIRDSARAGRCPSVIILRINDRHSDAFKCARWIRSQPAPIGTAWLVLLTDRKSVDVIGVAQLVVGSEAGADGLSATVSIALEATLERDPGAVPHVGREKLGIDASIKRLTSGSFP